MLSSPGIALIEHQQHFPSATISDRHCPWPISSHQSTSRTSRSSPPPFFDVLLGFHDNHGARVLPLLHAHAGAPLSRADASARFCADKCTGLSLAICLRVSRPRITVCRLSAKCTLGPFRALGPFLLLLAVFPFLAI